MDLASSSSLSLRHEVAVHFIGSFHSFVYATMDTLILSLFPNFQA